MKHFILLSLVVFCLFSCSRDTDDRSDTEALTLAQSRAAYKNLEKHWRDSVKLALQPELQKKVLTIGKNTMKIWWEVYGTKPADGRSLYISLHGGGGTTPDVNDSQWENQKKLYKPAEGVYLAPRAITNTWDLHFVPEADAFYERIIQMAVTHLDVNPDKVYLLGYSAGGDGVWRLAPRMADHWAAASMMAGHPGDVSLLSLRNTPFMIWCGALDDAYSRNSECTARIAEMEALQAGDPAGYIHEGHIVAGKSHWMDLADAAALPWMARFTRNPYPDRVVWCQGDNLKEYFYWLGIPAGEAEKGKTLIAGIDKANNAVLVEKTDYSKVRIYLNDTMLDLDKPVVVRYGDRELFNAKVVRNKKTLKESLQTRNDLSFVFPTVVEVAF